MTDGYEVHVVLPAREEETLLDLLRQHIAAFRIPFPLVAQGKETLMQDQERWGEVIALHCKANLTPRAVSSLEHLFRLLQQKNIIFRGAIMVKYRPGTFDDLEIHIDLSEKEEAQEIFEAFPAVIAMPAPGQAPPNVSLISLQHMSDNDRQKIRDFVSGLIIQGRGIFARIEHYWGADENPDDRDEIPLFDVAKEDMLVAADNEAQKKDGPVGCFAFDFGLHHRYTLQSLNESARLSLEAARKDRSFQRQMQSEYEALLAEASPAPQHRQCDACGKSRQCHQRSTGAISRPLTWTCRECWQLAGNQESGQHAQETD